MLLPFGQVRATMLRLGMRTSSVFNTQHVATGWPNPHKMLRPAMLRYVAFKSCYRLAGASNAGPTILDMLC